MLTIDGLAQPAPAELLVGYESVGRRETTADGSLAADRLALKRQAHVVWRGLGREEAARVLSALPFVYIYQLPLSIYIGRGDRSEHIAQLGIQSVWLVILAAVFFLAQDRVTKKVMVQGG